MDCFTALFSSVANADNTFEVDKVEFIFIGLIICFDFDCLCLPQAPRFNSRNNKKYFLSDTIT